MQYHEFIGQVQSRAHMAAPDDAVKATRATLETLAERLYGNEAEHIASQLPHEIAPFLKGKGNKEKYSIDEFFKRIRDKEGVELPDAIFHTKVVLKVLKDAVSEGEIDHIRDQLPSEYYHLFAFENHGNSDYS